MIRLPLASSPRRPLFRVFVAAALLVLGLSVRGEPASAAERIALSIRMGAMTHPFSVELAVSPAERSRGLMLRDSLPENGGMLFLYATPQVVGMWMKNTLIPLDMLFIDAGGVVRWIEHSAVPGSTRVISDGLPTLAVLELAGGTCERLGITSGAMVAAPPYLVPGE